MNFSFDFSGKNVFVFGGTSGINIGIAEILRGRWRQDRRGEPQPGKGRRGGRPLVQA